MAVHFPQATPKVTCQTTGDGLEIRVDELRQYGAIVLPVAAAD